MASVTVTGKVRYVVRKGVRKPTKLKDWYVVTYDKTATPSRKWSRKFNTKAEAENQRDTIAGAVRRREYVEPSRQPLSEFVDHWLTASRSRYRSSTFSSYDDKLRLHVLPTLGGTPLSEIDPPALNALYGQLLESGRKDHHVGAGLSVRTVRYVHTIVHRVLKDAVRWELLSRNPADMASAPAVRGSSPEMRVWTAEQLLAFLAASREHRGRGGKIGIDRLYCAWVVAATTGLRRGELLGLRWRDVDLDRGVLSVRQTVGLVKRDGKRTIGYGIPKTDKSRRAVALDTWTVADLTEHRERQNAERELAGDVWHDADLVFPARDGRPFNPEHFLREFVTRCDRYGVQRIALHDLRHTHATLALKEGIHPRIVQERLGHSTVSITLDIYSHVLPTMQEDAAAKIGAAVFGLSDGQKKVASDPR
jgi:integrase